MKKTLVIGDVHSHLHRVIDLLTKQGLIYYNPYIGKYDRTEESSDVEIVFVGDVGHFGGKPHDDIETWDQVALIADVILWGNHDIAVIDEQHRFNGFFYDPSFAHTVVPSWKVLQLGDSDSDYTEFKPELKYAHEAHGFLITHAGLSYSMASMGGHLSLSASKVAERINSAPESAVIHSVGLRRGGTALSGGILWRDIEESLHVGDYSKPFRQIFGHSADYKKHQVRKVGASDNTRNLRASVHQFPSYCIDVGGKYGEIGGDKIAGIWLPEEKVVYSDE